MTTLKIQGILGLQFASKALFTDVSESGLSKRRLVLFEVVRIQDKKKFMKCLKEGGLPDVVPILAKMQIQDIVGITIEFLKLNKKQLKTSDRFAFSYSSWSYSSKCFVLEVTRNQRSPSVEYLAFTPHLTKRSVTTGLNRLHKHVAIK